MSHDEGEAQEFTRIDTRTIEGGTVRRKTSICYCVLKLAGHGELYKMVEATEKFPEPLSRSLFLQLI